MDRISKKGPFKYSAIHKTEPAKAIKRKIIYRCILQRESHAMRLSINNWEKQKRLRLFSDNFQNEEWPNQTRKIFHVLNIEINIRHYYTVLIGENLVDLGTLSPVFEWKPVFLL